MNAHKSQVFKNSEKDSIYYEFSKTVKAVNQNKNKYLICFETCKEEKLEKENQIKKFNTLPLEL
jgi:hypothetical protein